MPNVVARLNAEIVKILAVPSTRDKLQAAGFEPASSPPQVLGTMYRDNMARGAPLVKELELDWPGRQRT